MQNTAQCTGRAKFLQRRLAAGEWLGIGTLIVIVCLLVAAALMPHVLDFIPPILAMNSG